MAALVIIDAVARLIPGVVGNHESVEDESFSHGLLEYPHYTTARRISGHASPRSVALRESRQYCVLATATIATAHT